MRFGMCADLLNAGVVAAAGFDYIEGSMVAITQASEGEFERMKSAVRSAGLKVEAMNLMMPGTLRLTGPNADLAPVMDFLEKGFCRGGSLGAKAVSFGASGAGRKARAWSSLRNSWPWPRPLRKSTAWASASRRSIRPKAT